MIPPEQQGSITDDPNEDYLVVLAEAVGAEALVSGDPHHTTPRRTGLRVVTPRGLLDDLHAR